MNYGMNVGLYCRWLTTRKCTLTNVDTLVHLDIATVGSSGAVRLERTPQEDELNHPCSAHRTRHRTPYPPLPNAPLAVRRSPALHCISSVCRTASWSVSDALGCLAVSVVVPDYSDYFRLLNGGYFDVGVYSLDEIVCFPPLQLGAGVAGGPSVKTAAQHAVWRAREVDADKACFGALTGTSTVKQVATNKVRKHSPAAVTPIIFSAGSELRACDNELLPIPEDRNGRQWVRGQLSTILVKFAFKISVQLWSRRDNSVVPTA